MDAGLLQAPQMPGDTPEGPAHPSALDAAPALAGPIDPATYRVGPGDVLQLQLWGRVSRTWLLPVSPEGYVVVPGSEAIRAHGMTLAELRSRALQKVGAQFRGVGMDLRLSALRSFRIYLTGEVASPGPMTATASHRVADVLTRGVLTARSSRRRIEVLHQDGTREIADLEVFTKTGRQNLNPWLRDGDVIHVPVATDFIWAQGALGRPGRYELGPSDSLITLFQLAGDPIPAADAERVLMVRWTDPFTPESLWVRLEDVYSRRTNHLLRDGDRIYVYYLPQYHLQHEVVIVGEVERPGPYPIEEGRHRFSDLVSAAGGFLPTADLSSIRVHRRSPTAGEEDPELDRLLRLPREQLTASEYDKLATKLAGRREIYRVDWARLSAARGHLDLLLRDGDVVRVERLVSSIRIDGEVRRPGILMFRSGLDVGDYVRQAGGFTDRAWKSRIRVTRAVTGQTLPARNVRVLDPGDFVWVPERPDRTLWDHTREILTGLAQIATVIIAIRTID
jgi:protein involved in polysaccharide export with SLBB domain